MWMLPLYLHVNQKSDYDDDDDDDDEYRFWLLRIINYHIWLRKHLETHTADKISRPKQAYRIGL